METSDIEDIPDDFFDEFSKESFIEGLSVIDSWGDEEKQKKQDGVEDRKLKSKGMAETKGVTNKDESLDHYIKPGSRRDPNKTNEAIMRDKQIKVKEYLSKKINSSDDLKPPGTELDDYMESEISKPSKPREERSSPHSSKNEKSEPVHKFVYRKQRPNFSPGREPHRGLRVSPGHNPYKWYKNNRRPSRSPHKSSLHSRSPQYFKQRRSRSPRYMKMQDSLRSRQIYSRSPQSHPARPHPSRLNRRSRSPQQRLVRRSRSPQHRLVRRSRSPRHKSRSPKNRSRSPKRRSRSFHRSRSPRRVSRSPQHHRISSQLHLIAQSQVSKTDNFLYPADFIAPTPIESQTGIQNYAPHWEPNSLTSYPEYSNYNSGPTGPAYSGYSGLYDYRLGPTLQNVVPETATVPMPVPQPVPPPLMSIPVNSTDIFASQAVPPPPVQDVEEIDPLAKLLASGKISKQDYLKLVPKKGIVPDPVNAKEKVEILNRCNEAIKKLSLQLHLPRRVIMLNPFQIAEHKNTSSKILSPLKRLENVDFHFTKSKSADVSLQNKQLVDSILTTIGFDETIINKNKYGKDIASQTTKQACPVCEIRNSGKYVDASTSTEPLYFTNSVQTQVLEKDLINSKSVFAPSGNMADGAPISISHLTPAQLVSQLAARAKSFQQDSQQRPPIANNPYHNFNSRGKNYRY